jgi:hypothetical protein
MIRTRSAVPASVLVWRDRRAGDHRLSGSARSAAVKLLAIDLADDPALGIDQGDLVDVVEAGGGGDVAEAEVARQSSTMAGAGLRNSQLGRWMPYCVAKAFSASGESKGWLKPMLMTLKRSAPEHDDGVFDGLLQVPGVVGQTWKQAV